MKKIRFYFLFILFYGFCFSLTPARAEVQSDFKDYKHPKAQFYLRQMAVINERIITDIKSAELLLAELKEKLEPTKDRELLLELLLLECEFHYAKTDGIHLKLAYYQALLWKTENTSAYHQLALRYYGVLNHDNGSLGTKEINALEHLLQEVQTKHFPFLEAKIERALGREYTKNEGYDASQEHFEKSLELFKTLNYHALIYDVKISQGISSFKANKYKQALRQFHEAEALARQKGFKKCWANAVVSLAEAELFIPGQLDSAYYHLKLFKQEVNHADERDVLNYYWAMEHYYLKRKMSDSAYFYLNAQVELQWHIDAVMKRATYEKVDLVFKKLENERQLKEERNTQKNFKLVFGLIGLFLLISSIVLWVVLKEKSRYNFNLMKQKDEILHRKKQLNLALKEKELLLKEIHHRVKNNLQIISSLLNIQAENIEDEVGKRAILASKERIQAIALIHQRLYQDDLFATISMQQYLGDLIEQLDKSYNDDNQQIRIVLNTNDIALNIDTAVPIGLIVCELTTNAFKYAFQGVKEGKLKIDLTKDEDRNYTMVVKDNGTGMVEGFDFLGSKTLGVEIVTALTDQLGGTMSYKSDDNGTKIYIKFKEINGQ